MSIEAMKQALECMEAAIKAGDWKVDGACDPDYVFVLLRAAIEQAEKQEPVAWTTDIEFDEDTEVIPAKIKGKVGTSMSDIPLYIAPPQHEWQGLTDDDWDEIIHGITAEGCEADFQAFSAIEAKLKEKNA